MSDITVSQDYDRLNYNPAMPILDVGISRPDTESASTTIEAIVDTGSDVTLIPAGILQGIGAQWVGRGYVRGVTGDRRRVTVYLVTFHVGNLRIHGLRAAALPDREIAILGRDVVNQLDLMLHGPAEVLEVLK